MTFLNCKPLKPVGKKKHDFIIAGLRYDYGSTGHGDNAMAPEAIRNCIDYGVAAIDPFTQVDLNTIDLRDAGDSDFIFGEKYRTKEAVRAMVHAVVPRARVPIFLGGDHSVTAEALDAFDLDVEVITLDAHLDCYDEHDNHGTWITAVAPRKVHVEGVRELGPKPSDNAHVLMRDQDTMLDHGTKVYLSVDLDVAAQGVSTPSAGAWSEDRLLHRVSMICWTHDVVGLDVVELCLSLDDGSTARLAHRVVTTALGVLSSKMHA